MQGKMNDALRTQLVQPKPKPSQGLGDLEGDVWPKTWILFSSPPDFDFSYFELFMSAFKEREREEDVPQPGPR